MLMYILCRIFFRLCHNGCEKSRVFSIDTRIYTTENKSKPLNLVVKFFWIRALVFQIDRNYII